MALQTVMRDAPKRWANSISDGRRVPGGHSPSRIGPTSARRICCQIGPPPSSEGTTARRARTADGTVRTGWTGGCLASVWFAACISGSVVSVERRTIEDPGITIGNGSQTSSFCIVYFETTFDANPTKLAAWASIQQPRHIATLRLIAHLRAPKTLGNRAAVRARRPFLGQPKSPHRIVPNTPCLPIGPTSGPHAGTITASLPGY